MTLTTVPPASSTPNRIAGTVSAVAVTEREEPQAVYGSHLHKIAYPANFAAFDKGGAERARLLGARRQPVTCFA